MESPSVVCTDRGVVVHVNAAWTRLCGYTREEMDGRNLKILQGPATDMTAVHNLVESVAAQKSVRQELVNYSKAGVPFKHVLQIVPLAAPDGSSCLFRATSEDVTLLRSACPPAIDQDADATCFLTDNDEDTAYLLSDDEDGDLACAKSPFFPMVACEGVVTPWAAQDGMVVMTQSQPPYSILWASEGWHSVCGYSSAEIVGRDLSLIQGPATDRGQVGLLMEAIRTRQPIEGLSLINYDKLNRAFRHTVSVAFVRSAAHADVLVCRAESSNVLLLNRGYGGAEAGVSRKRALGASPALGSLIDACEAWALPASPAREASNEEAQEYWGEDLEDFYQRWGQAAGASPLGEGGW